MSMKIAVEIEDRSFINKKKLSAFLSLVIPKSNRIKCLYLFVNMNMLSLLT